jgi:hypothetical protein
LREETGANRICEHLPGAAAIIEEENVAQTDSHYRCCFCRRRRVRLVPAANPGGKLLGLFESIRL